MINTVTIKGQQLLNGHFQTGNGSEKILIMGSCRVAPYVEYFHQWNTGNRFTIYSIDPFSWNWNLKNERVNYEEALLKLETDDRLLRMLGSVDVFIHEYYQNAGMFNVNREKEKSIYDFGMNPGLDICLPNFNDYFILFHDIIAFDVAMRKKAIQDYNVIGRLSDETEEEIRAIIEVNLERFYSVCDKSSLPEMKPIFKVKMVKKRMWHNSNHVTKHFTLTMLYLLNNKFLHLDLNNEFWETISIEDMFGNSFTPLSEFDRFDWGEKIVPLREKL
jgi:hypothetical protein